MMGKILVHELRSTRKALFTTLGIMMLVSVVSLTVAALRVPFLGALCLLIGVFAIAALVPAALIVLAVNYWRTMYGREGYFTMTIPVKGRTLFWAKVVYASIAAAVAAVLTLGGAALATISFGLSQRFSFGDSVGLIRTLIESIDTPLLGFIVAVVAVQLFFVIVAGAAIMSIGAEGRFNHLGIGAPVIGAVLLYVVMQVLALVSMLFVPFGLKIAGDDAGTFVARGMWHDFVKLLESGGAATSDPEVIGLGVLPVSVIVTVLLAWWGVRSIERRTSLR